MQMTITETIKDTVLNDHCPAVGCGGELDTGWECNKCGFDAMPIVKLLTLPTPTLVQ